MNLPSIEHLNEEELQALHTQVGKKLYGFWAVIEELADIEEERKHIRKYIGGKEASAMSKSSRIQALKDIGFSIVIYTHFKPLRIGIINYSMPKKNDNHYSITFDRETNSLIPDDNSPISDEDIKKIKEILEIDQ